MSSKVTGSRFEILNTSQSLVTGLLNKRARANRTTTKKKKRNHSGRKKSDHGLHLIQVSPCVNFVFFCPPLHYSAINQLCDFTRFTFSLEGRIIPSFPLLTPAVLSAHHKSEEPPIDKSREKIWRARVPSATARWPSPTFRRERGPRTFFF